MMMHRLLFQNMTNILRLRMFGLSNGLALCVIACSLTIYAQNALGYDYVEITTSSCQSVYIISLRPADLMSLPISSLQLPAR